MSEYIVKIIPRKPDHIIGKTAAENVIGLLKTFTENTSGYYDEIKYEEYDNTEFIDCGSDLETIKCPVCGELLDEDKWSESVNAAYETGFSSLETVMPCCGGRCSLNELDYYFPVGFAKCCISILNCTFRDKLNDETIRKISEIIGEDIKLIDAHY